MRLGNGTGMHCSHVKVGGLRHKMNTALKTGSHRSTQLFPDNVIILDDDAVDMKFYSLIFEPYTSISNVFTVKSSEGVKHHLDNIATCGAEPSKSVLIMDLQLEGGQAIELIKQLRQSETLSELTVLVVTNLEDPDALADATAAGANLTMSKQAFFSASDEAIATMIDCWRLQDRMSSDAVA